MTDKPTTEDWSALADKEVKGRDLTWDTPEGFAIKPLYTGADADESLQTAEKSGATFVQALATSQDAA